MAQVFGSLAPTWKTWIDFLTPGFSLVRFPLLPVLGEVNRQMGDFWFSNLSN